MSDKTTPRSNATEHAAPSGPAARAWMRIGEGTGTGRLERVATELESRWPGRYDFHIEPIQGPGAARTAAGFGLYLRHR